jgi:hypothetical protein
MDWCCDLSPHNNWHARREAAYDWLHKAATASLKYSRPIVLNWFFRTCCFRGIALDLLSGGGRFECWADYDLPVFLIIYPSIYIYLLLFYSHFFVVVGPWPLFHFLNPVHSRQDPWTGDKPVAKLLPRPCRSSSR